MSQRIKVKVQPNESLRFPGLCVNCDQPAPESMLVQARDGQTIRQIDVPLCNRCAGVLKRESAQEERLRKLSWPVIGLSAFLLMAIIYFLIPASIGFWPGLFLVLLAGLITAAIIWRVFRGLIFRAALPEKKAIRQAARIESFSRWATTLVFTNESFSQQFIELNESLLMEN